MRYRLKNVMQFVNSRARSHDVFPVGEECDLVPFEDLDGEHAEGFDRFEKNLHRKQPNARAVAIRLGGKVRWAVIGEDVESIDESGRPAAGTAARRPGRAAPRRPPPKREEGG